MDKSLRSRMIVYDICSRLYQSVVLIAILVVLCLIFRENLESYETFIGIGFIFIFGSRAYKSFIAPFIEVRVFQYTIDKEKIEYTEGVFVLRKTTVPIKRVQQVTTETNPLLKKMGLVKINILTITGSHYLRRVSIEEGHQIVIAITERIGEGDSRVESEATYEE